MNYRRFNFVLFALAIFVPISPTSTAAIFGDGSPANGIEDQRLLAPIDLQRSVGTVICDSGLRGTAVHISLMHGDSDSLQQGSIVLTAAHVLYDPDTAQRYEKCAYHPQGKRFSGVVLIKYDKPIKTLYLSH